MNKATATAIVKASNPDAQDVIIDDLLESSKGLDSDSRPAYRPYIVAARTLALNPPNANLQKADDLTWFDWKARIDYLLATQASLDCQITDIPCGQLTTEFYIDLSFPVSALVVGSGGSCGC